MNPSWFIVVILGCALYEEALGAKRTKLSLAPESDIDVVSWSDRFQNAHFVTLQSEGDTKTVRMNVGAARRALRKTSKYGFDIGSMAKTLGSMVSTFGPTVVNFVGKHTKQGEGSPMDKVLKKVKDFSPMVSSLLAGRVHHEQKNISTISQGFTHKQPLLNHNIVAPLLAGKDMLAAMIPDPTAKEYLSKLDTFIEPMKEPFGKLLNAMESVIKENGGSAPAPAADPAPAPEAASTEDKATTPAPSKI